MFWILDLVGFAINVELNIIVIILLFVIRMPVYKLLLASLSHFYKHTWITFILYFYYNWFVK